MTAWQQRHLADVVMVYLSRLSWSPLAALSCSRTKDGHDRVDVRPGVRRPHHPLSGRAARAHTYISARGTTIPNGVNSVITGSGRVQPAAARAPSTGTTCSRVQRS